MVSRKIATTNAPDSPVHRTTIAGGDDHFWRESSDLLHWVWSWQVQFGRLRETTALDGQGTTPIEKRKSFSRASLDEHLLAVVGGHVVTAMRQFGDNLPQNVLQSEHLKALELLRNLYEHWDEQRLVFSDPTRRKERSAKRFADGYPEGRPYSITYTTDEWLLGGVVPLNRVTEGLELLAGAVVELENTKRGAYPQTGGN